MLPTAAPTPTPTESEQEQRLREAKENELAAEQSATALFAQLINRSHALRQNMYNQSIAAHTAQLLSSTVDEVTQGPRKQVEASIESNLSSLRVDISNLTRNSSMITAQGKSDVQLKITKVEAAMSALRELDRDEITALHRGCRMARKSEKKNDKSLAKEASHAAKAWLKAAKRTMKAQKHAGIPETVYERQYGEVEHPAEQLMDQIGDLRTDMSNDVEKFFDLVEMHLRATLEEKREELNVKEAEYEEELLQLQSRFNEATTYTHSFNRTAIQTLRGGRLSARQISSTGSKVYPTALTEATVVMESSNGWFGFPALVLAFLFGSLFVFVMDHFRFRRRRRSSVQAPLLLG